MKTMKEEVREGIRKCSKMSGEEMDEIRREFRERERKGLERREGKN